MRINKQCFAGIVALTALSWTAPVTFSADIPPNSTLFITVGNNSYFPFSQRPIPADFFFDGSPVFNQNVPVKSEPLTTYNGHYVGPTDTVISQLATATLPGPGSSDTVAMQLSALSLGSISPITVGGTHWNVHMGLSSTMPTMGTMTITQNSVSGGVWEGSLNIFVKATFTEVGNPSNVRVLDTGGQPPLVSATTGPTPWTYATPPEYAFVPGLTANFFTASHEHTKEGHESMQATARLTAVPAISNWGVAVLLLLTLTAATVEIMRRRARTAA